jgi:methylenetetrahydrofolate reductase (NADPH)
VNRPILEQSLLIDWQEMIELQHNRRLKEILYEEARFPLGVELVSTRGTMSQQQSLKTRAFAEQLTYSDAVDWVSITDNAGGNPQMAPIALGTPILYAGKEVVVHLTCKDLNRHALESQLWMYASQGFHNVLALTGDYPMAGPEGLAKPVFDIDSVGLLHVIQRMNNGLEVKRGVSGTKTQKLDSTYFFPGAVCTPYKCTENTLLPQYYKLEKKIENGAEFIIPQIGFDARKASELITYMSQRSIAHVPVIGNVYLLTPFVARLFHQQKIPGVVVSDGLYELCQKHSRSPDKGKAFFREFAAKQIAIYQGLGYKGAYMGGVHDYHELEQILAIQQSFASDDWKGFAKEMCFSRADEFCLYGSDDSTGLADPNQLQLAATTKPAKPSKHVNIHYQMAKAAHRLAFENGKGLAPAAKRLCNKGTQQSAPPKWLRLLEHASKSALFACQNCGDCSLGETGFLCPESQCAKNQRNGPCGGTRNGRCEVLDKDCIWSRAYDRKKSEGCAETLLDFVPVFQDQSLRGTSGWANYWHGLDHQGKNQNLSNSISLQTKR